MSTIAPVKGARDFYPQDMAFRRWLYDRIREVAEAFGYQEFDGPYLERLELYAAKSGEELVKEQSFVFADRSGEMIALRPELTPSLARMVATRSQSLPSPLRWWSFGPFWRYERPQKGRTREFFQWNIDLLGVDTPQADCEIAAIGARFFAAVGLSPEVIRILVNNRRLVDAQLGAIGIPEGDRPSVFRLIDRKDRLSPREWEADAAKEGLSQSQRQGLSAILSDGEAWRESEDLVAFFETAEAMGVAEYMAYDPSIIRGLDYYTGTVYEARDAAGEFRAVLGGGRYDNLVADVGGTPISGTGFAMGDVVLQLVLEAYDALPTLRANPADVLVTTFSEQVFTQSIQLAGELRDAGLRAEWFPEASRIPKQLKYADREGIPIAVVLGPDEIRAGQVAVKDLRVREQWSVPRQEAAEFIRARLAQG
jgi:histidyl-tRNA synthetase